MKQLLLFLLIAPLPSLAQDTVSAVFFGNSYTASNNLPSLIANIAQDKGDFLIQDAYTPGGQTLSGHASDLALFHSRISQKNYDYVVIQAQSQEPSFSPGQVAAQTLPYARQLDSVVNSIDTCIKTMFFMTWGRENGDQFNCPNYPPVCTYEGMQKRLRESYLLMADQNDAEVAPVGAVWKQVRDSSPNIQLYTSDGSHPSLAGSYLAACTFYSSMFHKEATTFYDPGLGAADAFAIQSLASSVVLDSLSTWRIDTSDFHFGDTSFVYEQVQNGGEIVVQAKDTTLYRYDWKLEVFGYTDTVTIHHIDTSYNLIFQLPADKRFYPNYKITLTLFEACESYRKSISDLNDWLLSSVNSIHIAPHYKMEKGILRINMASEVNILDLMGREVYSSRYPTFKADLRYLEQGVYLLQLRNAEFNESSKLYVH